MSPEQVIQELPKKQLRKLKSRWKAAEPNTWEAQALRVVEQELAQRG